ncbi:MAG: amphi-Trp domain-containing protein [Fodinibius sp.]|nr:amphi-Trp domain-containing protein [Fodinibius sp.]
MSKRDLYRLEEEQSLEQIAEFLEQKASELRNGKVIFSNDVTLELPNQVVLDIDVDQRDKTDITATSVEIELKWAE